ncbi:PAS domain S-box protein [Mucilaginibacter arboris]|nr:PAS domain S-box protein [Mucilaginibacter arboris]
MEPLQEPLFQNLFNHLAEPHVVVKADSPRFTVVACNKQYKAVSNTLNKDIIGMGIKEISDLKNANYEGDSIIEKALNKAIETRQVVKLAAVRYDIPSADGLQMQQSWWQTEYIPVLGQNGKAEYLLCTIHNITEQVTSKKNRERAEQQEKALRKEQLLNEELAETIKKLEESQQNLAKLNNELEDRVASRTKALSDSEARFRNMIEQSPVAMLVNKGDDLIFEIVNQPMLKLIGKGDAIKGKPLYEAIPELKGQPVVDKLYHTYQTGEEWTGYEQLVLMDREGKSYQGYYNVTYKPLIENGQITGVLEVAVDVTEQVQARQKILESETMFRAIFEQSPLAFCVLKGRDLVTELANDNILKLWGKTRQEVIGKPQTVARPEVQGLPWLKLINQVYTTGVTHKNPEFKILMQQDGKPEEGYFNAVYQPLKDAEGQTSAILVILEDVTDKVKAQQQVDQAQQQFRQAVDSANMGTWSINPASYQLTFCNRSKEIFGFSLKEDVSNRWAMNAVDPAYRQMVRKAIAAGIEKHEACDLEYPIINHISHERKWVRVTGKMFFDENNRPALFSGLLMDITTRKLDDIRKNDFIAIVSHELKTPLTTLKAYAQMLTVKSKKAEDVFTVVALEKVNSQVKKMTGLINSFLNVSRLEAGKIHLDKVNFSLDELVKERINEFALTIKSHIISLSPCGPLTVFADYEKIGQVINNLLTNAIKYSPAGKRIEVSCQSEEGMARISVKDEGMGIKAHDISKLFERFYRVEGRHTQNISGFGIGLYLCAEIIQRHNGKIGVESEIGKGSNFWFTLPLS